MANNIEQKITFCRICEPLCGMVATVEDGRLTALRPDKDHPLSSGFACQKGIAFTEVVNDPDRVTTPLRRTADGFEPVGWDEAMADIAARLGKVLDAHGSGAVGWYFGNPGAFSYSHLMWVGMFVAGLGQGAHMFTASSQDINNRLVASQLLYGVPTSLPIPDVLRTDLLVVIGANPVVSHGSVLTVPRIKDHMHAIVKRGGRVLVIDPRRTETAAQFEWLGIVPDGDAFLLLSLLQVMFDEQLVDRAAVARQADGLDWLEALCRPYPPEQTVAHTGIDPETVRGLARDLVRTRRAAVYGRFGTSAGRNGTLTTYLLDAVNIVAGNADRAGGMMLGGLGIPGQRWLLNPLGAVLQREYRRTRTRVGDFPTVLRSEPATMMAKEISTPGKGQIRALFVSAGNPVLSVPNGLELEEALEGLDLMVGLDFYVTETTSHCDYILPVTTMYERDDFGVAFQAQYASPFRQATEAVIEPVGQARPEWQIIDDLMARLAGRSVPFRALGLARKALRPFGLRPTPRRMIDGLIRLSEGGDLFGLRRRGLTFDRLVRDHPHGVVLKEHVAEGTFKNGVTHRGGRMRLKHNEIAEEMERLNGRAVPDGYPMRMIGMRETRSENSWMHNAPLLMRGGRTQRAVLHVDDAAELGVSDGDVVTVASPWGSVEVPVELTKDIVTGVVAIPHGWGHKGTGGWQVANRAGGANVNQLMSTDPADIEAMSGMAWLTGIPIRVEPVG